ncbi:LysR family transcriptional regulator [Shewanella sp. 10N.286.48.B5]|uniref:LysR family transcriptional regulator n=1 Tax=Shewanella sp. 10N.286.48.B5 TaxID=1880834 RepID=UPI000C85627A|nr:LysR family transcriptional regulator [Shewanella sp. 10N.286.48.B5]PMH88963.1 hypothetical protein BCU57_03105 [Shewanella sp. 10N.286.48.B5]
MQKQLSRLDYFTLKVLIGLFEFKNGSIVAEKLNSTQPKISRALSNMREVIHDELFIRKQYGLQPNAMASRLYPLAKNIIAAYDQMAVVANTQPEQHKVLHIAAPEQMSSFIFKSIEQVSKSLNISLTVDINPWTENVEQLIVQGKLDYAISSREFMHENVINNKLGDIEFRFLAVKKGHPILQKPISLETILDYRLIFINNAPIAELTTLVDLCSKTVNKKANISLITSSLLMAFERAAHSEDICSAPSVFPYELAKKRDDIELIDITEFYNENLKHVEEILHPKHFLQYHDAHDKNFTTLLSDSMTIHLKSAQDSYKKIKQSQLLNI